MTITVTYTPAPPPPPVEGTITVTMPVSVAARLHALLSVCNGSVETGIGITPKYEDCLWVCLNKAVPDSEKVYLKPRFGDRFPTIDIHGSKFAKERT